MRVLVIGAGAVGSFLGGRLAADGHDVTLVGRQSLVDALRSAPLSLCEPEGTRQVTGISAVDGVSAAFAGGATYDLALITVKAYDTAAVAAELATAAPADRAFPLLTLQNGVGNEEILAERWGAGRTLAGAIDTPVSIPAPGQVTVHRAAYRIGLAPVEASASGETVAAVLSGAGFQVTCFRDYRSLKWTKLLMNILANATCAILDWTPGRVMAVPETARLEAVAWQEALAVMPALGIRPVSLGGYPFPLLLPVARRLPAPLLAAGLRKFVSGGRGSKMPSLNVALHAGKPSEVPWLNGAIVDRAVKLGMMAPVNAVLTRLLLGITKGELQWDEYRDRPDRLIADTGLPA